MVALGASGDELGVIEDVVLEGAARGRVRYVVIRRPGLLRTILLPMVGSPRDVIVPLAALRFSARGDMVRLDASAEQLREAPGFQNSDLERLQQDQEWQRAIAAYYGVDADAAPQPMPQRAAAAAQPEPQQPAPAVETAPSAHTAQADAAHGKAVAGNFLKSPRGWAPGTRMAYPGISNDRDRADVVAYLNQLK